MRSFTDTNLLASGLTVLTVGVLLSLRFTAATVVWLCHGGRWLLRLLVAGLRTFF
ncbi:MAG TPA: hypothetical protein VF546_13270 [Pyrinomonadaceae bacterium]|jgi:hypothetical protein